MKTAVTKSKQIERRWYVTDGEGEVLGRLATRVARLLLGKDRPEFTPAQDIADFVIVINAEKVRLTGRKSDQKRYYRHSGYPGGLKTETVGDVGPVRMVKHAVRGMLPKNRLQAPRMSRLKVYPGPDHPHEAQNPIRLDSKEEGTE